MKGKLFLHISAAVILVLGLATAGPDAAQAFKIIMVTDTAGLGDRSFNDAGWAGVQRARKEMGVEVGIIQSYEQADYVPNLNLAAKNANAVVAMGYLLLDAMRKIAPLHPETNFIFIDGTIADIPNVASFDFKAQEGAFLAGIIAAAVTRTGVVGAVEGMEIPPVKVFEAGYRAGIKTYNALRGTNVQLRVVAAGAFDNPSKGKSLARMLIAQGADVVIQMAGNTGTGVFEAVKEAPPGIYAMGTDLDQDAIIPGRVLTSVMKRIDNAAFQAISDARAGRFKGGHYWIGLKEGAVCLTDMKYTRHIIPAHALAMVEKASALIKKGKLQIPVNVRDVESFQPPGL
ncbi:MAG: BMP family ABC transporter substrate-binding protein [Deltaproteobacteria bacterium]|nr:BMP family ABC transporter substrate-binding protein [Deltaproteobacteria bacterium]MBW2307989.1 BMP family ABC transporter substrate-binding protein [Deltaproteobacteria bacterium]